MRLINKKHLLPLIILVAMLGLLAYVLFTLIRDVGFYTRGKFLNLMHRPRELFVGAPPGGAAMPVEAVAPWMTFDYLEKIFHLPQNFFKDKLAIADPRYPHLSIQRYASRKQIPTTDLLMEVRSAIRQTTVSSTTSTTR